MPENEIQKKVFRLKKVVPNNLIMVVYQYDNPQIKRTIRMTDRNPFQMLPWQWALSIFMDEGNYNLYKKGYITFDRNDELVKLAYESGAYFDDKLDFTPAKEDNEKVIFTILQGGNRTNIMNAINKYGRALVQQIAITHRDELSAGVVNMLEGILKIQLFVDGGDLDNPEEK